MSVTPEFGWPLIEPTDFVTNLPADFEAFADAVDATVKSVEDLNPITTEGDLVVGDASGDPVRLPIGSIGQVLTSDGDTAYWDTAGGGSITLLSTTALTGNTVDITNISQDYKELKILVYGINPSTNTTPSIRFRNSTTDQTGTMQSVRGNSVFNQVAATAFWVDGLENDNYVSGQTDNLSVFNVELYAETREKPVTLYGSGRDRASGSRKAFMGGGALTDTNPINAIRISLGGAITFSAGTVEIYGVK